MELAGVKNSPVSNLVGTLLKKSRDTLFCILFRFYRLESSTRLLLLRGWSKSIVGGGRGGAGAFRNVVDKKHMAHPLPSAQR